jgi:hypothetical protein
LKILLRLFFGVTVAAAIAWPLYRLLGAVALAWCAPLLGVALARPLVEILSGVPRFYSGIVLRKVNGRYFEYRGSSLDIHVDERATCWISTADLRKIVALPADPVLRKRYPLQCRELGEPIEWRLGAEALIEFLGKSTEPDTTKFSHWVDKTVITPARNKRTRRLGTDRVG